MKHLFLSLVLVLATACTESAQSPHLGRGVVVEVKRAENQVVLDHEEIPGVMKAMTMGFDVARPALLDGIETGQAVEFELVYENGRYSVSALRPE